MKNKQIVIAIIVVIILIAGIWIFMSGQKNNGQPVNAPTGANSQTQPNPATNNSGTQTTTTTTTQTNTFSGSLADLMAKKSPVNCQVSFDQNGTTQTQSMYFDGTNLRTDMVITIAGQPNTTHLVIKDGWEYMWSDSAIAGMTANTGTKINFSQLQKPQTPAAAGTTPSNGGLDTQKTMNFSCTPWIADASKFDLPANIQFQDLTSLTQTVVPASGGTPGAPASACDMCKLIPAGDARTQCQASCASAPKQ